MVCAREPSRPKGQWPAQRSGTPWPASRHCQVNSNDQNDFWPASQFSAACKPARTGLAAADFCQVYLSRLDDADVLDFRHGAHKNSLRGSTLGGASHAIQHELLQSVADSAVRVIFHETSGLIRQEFGGPGQWAYLCSAKGG